MRPNPTSEDGSVLLETVIALSFVAVALTALLGMYTSNILTLRHSGTAATATTLAERQTERYKILPYTDILLDTTTIPSNPTDPYNTAHLTDPNIPAPSNQLSGGTIGTTACINTTTAQPQCATQTTTGPDGHIYRIDSYIHQTTPTSSRQVKTITVAVREVQNGTANPKIWALVTTIADRANPPT